MKSDVSQFLDLGLRILMDAAAKCYTATVADWQLDFKRLTSRFEHEGLSFLTITLPAFGASFEDALSAGQVDSTHWPGWAKRGCLPVFLRGFTSLVFEQDGRIKEDPDVAAIEGVRQLAYTFKKILLPCTKQREIKALEDYLTIERDLEDPSVFSNVDGSFDSYCRLLWGDVFGYEFDSFSTIPKHGPGVTAEGYRHNRKYSQPTWHDRLQPYFPYDESAFSNTLIGSELLGSVKFIPENEELPVKVTLVPKTLKTPRIIAIEPCCMQYTQQAISRYLTSCLEAHPLTSGHINFSDQSINQGLAMVGSRTGQYATLDLSSASDRVPLIGVQRMLSVNEQLLAALMATRSTRAKMPDGSIIDLRKFASMGSATCFPIESMFFFSVISWAIWKSSGLPLTLRNIDRLTRDVYVYGDDIVVPTGQVEVVLQALADTNCKVGYHKSFWTGKFRESCGVEAFDGEDVTPTYIRQLKPESKRDASSVVSWIATSNLFYSRGYWKTAAYMKSCVESVVGKLPLVQEFSAGLGWVNYQNGYSVHRFNRKLHRYEVRTYVASPVYYKDHVDGYPALMKCLLSATKRGSTEPDANIVDKASGDVIGSANYRTNADSHSAQDVDHLHRSARYGAVSIKRRWTTPY